VLNKANIKKYADVLSLIMLRRNEAAIKTFRNLEKCKLHFLLLDIRLWTTKSQKPVLRR